MCLKAISEALKKAYKTQQPTETQVGGRGGQTLEVSKVFVNQSRRKNIYQILTIISY